MSFGDWEHEDEDGVRGVDIVLSNQGLCVTVETEDGRASYDLSTGRTYGLLRWLAIGLMPESRELFAFIAATEGEEVGR